MVRIRLIYLFVTGLITGCQGQDTPDSAVGLPADFDKVPPFFYKMPEVLLSSDTSPAWGQGGQKILLTGTVYQSDGRTPASEVILYYYQTDVNGIYAVDPGMPRNMPRNERGQSHGYIRGWVKTGLDGTYAIRTVRPGTYPSRDEPAHVHVSVLEKNEPAPYYLDDFVFDDDLLLTSERRNRMENRGGSGVIRFVGDADLLIGERNIILGLNIPGYEDSPGVVSGRHVGEDLWSFTPQHAWGPDKGTKTCPICKYGWYQGVLYFVGNNADWTAIRQWLVFLEEESLKRRDYLKVYFIYGGEEGFDQAERSEYLEDLGAALGLQSVALTFVPSFTDRESDVWRNRINPEAGNTFLIYRRSNVIGNYTNLAPTQENFIMITELLDRTDNDYLRMPRPGN